MPNLPSVAKATGCRWLAALKHWMFAVSEIPAVNTFFVSMMSLEVVSLTPVFMERDGCRDF